MYLVAWITELYIHVECDSSNIYKYKSVDHQYYTKEVKIGKFHDMLFPEVLLCV